jgi:hypothetical protein
MLHKLKGMNDFASFAKKLTANTPALCPQGAFDAELSEQIKNAEFFSDPSSEMARAATAGLLLFNDDLDAAHAIVQSPETPINNFWHAIIHRREGDFSNARYWWNRTKHHPAMDEIFDIVIHRVPDFDFIDELRQSQQWEPFALNDFCERAAKTGEWEKELREVQRLEMKILLEWCAARAK